ncbi:H-X9-DG-CTERM domain-containing protein [Planctomicrobium sp. SH664]|uniref:H-X9-DG-CTERM domain-containing protein n=1 Tax=Planctomicrobium sp. SH664 TaxID=3448125 RepID=UPI003F5B3030
MHEFHCPHCSTPLRLRDKSLRGRTIDCPDCRQPLRVEETANGFIGSVVESTQAAPDLFEQPGPVAGSARWLAIAGAVVLVLGGLWFALRMGEPTVVKAPPADLPQPEGNSPEASATAPPVREPEPAAAKAEGPEERLLGIYTLMLPQIAEQDLFPAGVYRGGGETPRPYSWIAPLAGSTLPPARIDWDERWNAPVNDEFVRRRFQAFDNPALETKVGEDRYPASHFVGITGVGADSATLPAQHPRAGIFAQQRQTKLSDVKDGLSNTLLLAGVTGRLGSWARADESTQRGLTQEPYINGPDGFGTGQPDGMFVLLADGSVRFLSKATDPVLMRRMAAMADGLPLNLAVAGDPLTMNLPVAVTTPPVAGTADPPVVPEAPIPAFLEMNLPKFDIAQQLSQPVLRFEQSTPAPLVDLLQDLGEAAGVPIDFSQLPEETRRQTVAITLENTTVGNILDAVLAEVHVTKTLEPFRIVLTPAPQGTGKGP